MLNRLSFIGIVLISISLVSQPAVGANLKPDNSDKCEYVLEGELVSSDPDIIEAIIVSSGFKTLCLNSPGGSFLAGMKLADIFMTNGIQTYLRAGDECYSACAIAFLGGSIWGDLRHVSRTLEPGGKLGFHSPYLALPKGEYNSEYVEGKVNDAIALISFLISQKTHLKINDNFLTEFAFFHGDNNALNMVETVRDAAIVGLELSKYTKPKTEANSYKNACSLLFNLYEDYFMDRVTASRPYFSLRSSDMERQIFNNSFEIDGEQNVMVSTVSDWELYTPTAACAFNPIQTWSGAVQVVMWSNGFNESPIYENAERKLEIIMPDWYFLDAETSLDSLR